MIWICEKILSLTYLAEYQRIVFSTQKNPSAVRHPEEDQPDDMFTMDLLLNVAASHVISPYIAGLCDAAKDMTYTRDSDLKLIAQSEFHYIQF